MNRKVSTSEGTSDFLPMYEPYMLTENVNKAGIEDFVPRKMTGCNNMWVTTHMQILQTLMTKNAGDF